jgi:hypothetical protein
MNFCTHTALLESSSLLTSSSKGRIIIEMSMKYEAVFDKQERKGVKRGEEKD